MPFTKRMTSLEMTRAVNRIESTITAVDTKLGNMPDWDDIARQETNRDKEQTQQDKAIAAVEGRLTTLMFAVIGAALTAAAGVFRTL